MAGLVLNVAMVHEHYCGEIAAIAELPMALDLAPAKGCEALLECAARVGAMLTNLIRRFS